METWVLTSFAGFVLEREVELIGPMMMRFGTEVVRYDLSVRMLVLSHPLY